MRGSLLFVAFLAGVVPSSGQTLEQPANTWVKRSPLPDGPRSPALGYEGSFGYDAAAKRLIRWAGHNQGGGGEQNAETWAYDPATARWELKEPNVSPPGVCCAQQNLFDPIGGRFLRFRAFSGSHGWQWFREIYMNNSSVWSYHLPTNTWRDMRTVPAPLTSPLRCASWDSAFQVAVVFGGEGSSEGTIVYDPFANMWTRMRPAKEPTFRSGGNMAYDKHRKLHILFGSQFGNDPHTWGYDLAKNEWIDLAPTNQPPTDRNDAVLAYDEVNSAIVANIRAIDASEGDEVTKGHYETWVLPSKENAWRQMKPNVEAPGNGNRRRIMAAIPDQNVILMENYVNPAQRIPGIDREQQIWTYRYASTPKESRLVAPVGLSVSTTKSEVRLAWHAIPAAKEYEVLLGVGSRPGSLRFQPVGRTEKTTWTDPLPARREGEIACFKVRGIEGNGVAGADSSFVRMQPALVDDVVVTVRGKTETQIEWPAVEGAVGYVVERAPVEVFSEDQIVRLRKDTDPLVEPSVGAIQSIGEFRSMVKEPITGLSFVDTTIDLGRPAVVEGKPIFSHRFQSTQIHQAGKPYRFGVYAYRVRAINAAGVQSGPGPYALTIPTSPTTVFAKEAGDDAWLKWTSNPERSLQGYRVYRMESPRINGPGQKTTRLTPNPVPVTQFQDVGIGRETRRYWIVAVDALGQEGFPSAPAWHYRQYRSYYVPFTGEWHQ
ncbi:MAG: hypothetical protein U0744_02385 [Gemmataceae bacterium]